MKHQQNQLSKLEKLDIVDFFPDGSDERQFCSPGFNLPVGQISRTVYLNYKQYHSSLDNKKFMNINNIKKSVEKIEILLKRFDDLNGEILRRKKYSEIFLQKYNLYKDKRIIFAPKTKKCGY